MPRKNGYGMAFTASDKFFMHQCLNLAKRGLGFTAPNPVVGAVVVREGLVAGKGFHAKAGTDHAEIIALRRAGERAQGATLYVSLEPCAHFGRTPPCVKEIIARKIGRVVIAMRDPNPSVDGKGIEELKKAGISVEVGLLEGRARRLNEVFITNVTARRPFIALKAASSLDGKIAAANGASKWITSEKSRLFGRRLRGIYDSVMVGIGTVLKDDPGLLPDLPLFVGKKTSRIVVDSRARIPMESVLVKTASQTATIVAVTKYAIPAMLKKLTRLGATVLLVNDEKGRVDLEDLIAKLDSLGISSVLVEGGGELLGSFVEQGLFDKLYLFLAPKLIGGDNAPSVIRGKGVARIEDAVRLKRLSLRHLDDDLLIELYPTNTPFAEED
jgi:diaminohydroxyphosphoribosylaminopyrimidine deaminase/5-amino-6-(5-phosphoribosylamino)uracil reductase